MRKLKKTTWKVIGNLPTNLGKRFIKLPVLEIIYHGLGDSLAWSTLPERYGSLCLHESYKDLIRSNPEIYDLIWKPNPYFLGFSNKVPNIGNRFSKTKRCFPQSVTWQLERLHGFIPKSKYPKLYLDLKYAPNGMTIIDLNCRRNFLYFKSIINVLKDNIIESLKDEKNVYYISLARNQNDLNTVFKGIYRKLEIGSLLEYINIIHNCKRVVASYSGISVLTSAIKQDRTTPEADVFIQRRDSFYFENINYHLI